MQVLGDIVRLNARRYPEKTAVIMDDETLTYEQLNRMANKIAEGFCSIGVKPGDRIALWSPNCLHYIPILFAIWKCGGVAVPINFRFKLDELLYTMENCLPKVLVFSREFEDAVKQAGARPSLSFSPIPIYADKNNRGESLEMFIEENSGDDLSLEVDPSSSAMIMYTSGTTGAPKGAVFSHAKQLIDIGCLAAEGNLCHEDIMLINMPLFHNGGISATMLPTFYFGGTCVVTGGSFDTSHVLSLIEKYRITVTLWVPTMLSKLVNSTDINRYDCSSLRKIWYGSAPMNDAVLSASREAFQAGFYQTYAQTETGMLLMTKPEDHETGRAKFTGREVHRAEVRVVDENGNDTPIGQVGEIISRHRPLGMECYYGMEEKTEKTIKNGWIHTGDLARVEPQRYFTIVDRLKDMIISGAENIYCKEVENVISEHSGVAEVAVFGIYDETWGEAVCAAVSLIEGYDFTEKEIIDFCSERLSSYKKPKKVEIWDELPKNASGKILKQRLRAPYWEGRDKRV